MDSEWPVYIAMLFYTFFTYFRFYDSNIAEIIFLDQLIYYFFLSHFSLLIHLSFTLFRSSGRLVWMTDTHQRIAIWAILIVQTLFQWIFARLITIKVELSGKFLNLYETTRAGQN